MKKYEIWGIILLLSLVGVGFLGKKEAPPQSKVSDLVIWAELAEQDRERNYEEIKIKEIAENIEKLRPNLPEKTVDRYAKAVHSASKKTGVNPKLILSVIRVESNYNPSARGGVGEIGLAQVTPIVWSKYFKLRTEVFREKLYDPEFNIEAGAFILKYYLKQCNATSETTFDSNYAKTHCALGKYNGSYPRKTYSAKIERIYRRID